MSTRYQLRTMYVVVYVEFALIPKPAQGLNSLGLTLLDLPGPYRHILGGPNRSHPMTARLPRKAGLYTPVESGKLRNGKITDCVILVFAKNYVIL